MTLEQEQHPSQSILDRECLEERLPVGDREVEMRGDHVRELTRVADLGHETLDRLAREAGLGAQLHGPLTQLPDEREVRRRLCVERRHLLRVAHGRYQVVVVLRDA